MAPLAEWLRDIRLPAEHETLVCWIATSDSDDVGAILHDVLQLDFEPQFAESPRDVNGKGLLTTRRTENPADSLRKIDDHIGVNQTTRVNSHDIAPCSIDPGCSQG